MKLWMKLRRLLNTFWAIPMTLLMRLIRPLILIKIIELFSERIGHFVPDSIQHSFELSNKDKNEFHFFWFIEPAANKQWAKIVKRNLWVFQFLNHVDYWNKKIPGGDIHRMQSWNAKTASRDIDGNFERNIHSFNLTSIENTHAKNWLKSFGWKEGQKFICLQVRDSAYLKSKSELHNQNANHDIRDSQIDTYSLGIKWLLDQGIWVIRMGKLVHSPIMLKHEHLIDFPYSNANDDLLDVWLFGNCTLCISTLSGIDFISDVYRRPLLIINFMPILDIVSWSNAMHIPKKLVWQDSLKELTLKENLSLEWPYIEYFKKNGIKVEDLTSQEILLYIKECWKSLDEQELDYDHKILQVNFWKTFINPLEKYNVNQINPANYHGWKHPRFRMSKNWLQSRPENYFD
ncbi:TIGR04372 family glycosyltransferase [Gammaproteobacteria bacterium]|nr:TIGR04372 family glycosyltransferase [Gammaproteobacteria bacterium]